VRRYGTCGPAAVCVVRGLGTTPAEIAERLPALRGGVTTGRGMAIAKAESPALKLPHPVL
jgi:hydroxymethylpyrimidine kinase/phosphomethylpyrimidine kinase/thiamine-phosphate diphosphorylase